MSDLENVEPQISVWCILFSSLPVFVKLSAVQSVSQESVRVHSGPPYWPLPEGPRKRPHHRFLRQCPQSWAHHGWHQLHAAYFSRGGEVGFFSVTFFFPKSKIQLERTLEYSNNDINKQPSGLSIGIVWGLRSWCWIYINSGMLFRM